MIHLVVPGLLGPFPRFAETGEAPRLPALERLLARGDKASGPESYPQALFALYGVPGEEPLPTAPVCYHADSGGQAETRSLLHADPIHLRPDQDRLLGFDFHRQPLDDGLAPAFIEAFNAHFADDGLELIAPHPTRWYLALDREPDVRFQPLAEILGRNIDLFLPQGPDAGQWRAWMNEVQMLFHSLQVNDEREVRGKLPLNGLWFSGGGYLPSTVPGGFSQVSGDCCLLRGLNMLSSGTGEDELIVDHGAGRAVLDGDRDAWQRAIIALDAQLQSLMSAELRLYVCDGRAWHWQPKMRRRWWRRQKAFDKYVG